MRTIEAIHVEIMGDHDGDVNYNGDQVEAPTMESNLDIRISLDREVYFPGDTISGTVFLNNGEDREMRGIKLTLSCNVSVKFPDKHGEQFNDITYLQKELYIMGEGKQTILREGQHELTFSEVLTCKNLTDLPSSMEFPYGCARYQVKVELDWPWSYCQEAIKTVNVCNICDLADHPESNQPASFTNQWKPKSIDSCFGQIGNKMIIIAGRLEKIAYVPGEHLLLNAEINNESDSNIQDTILRINQIVTYESTGKKTQRTERPIFEVRKGPLGSWKDLVIEEESLIIPAVPQSASMPCDFMKVSYQVEIGVMLAGNKTIWATQAIFIGTLPTKNAYKRFVPTMSKPLSHIAQWPIEINGLPTPTFEQAFVESSGNLEPDFVIKYPVFEFNREETLKHLDESDVEDEAEQKESQFSL